VKKIEQLMYKIFMITVNILDHDKATIIHSITHIDFFIIDSFLFEYLRKECDPTVIWCE
jgi:hypothetical protein